MKKAFKKISNLLAILMTLAFIGVIAGAFAVFYVMYHYSQDLPAYSQLEEYSPPTITRLYAADGRMMEEYAKEKRLFVPIHAIPKKVVNAFIAAEDQNFYEHPGVDFVSVFRAMLHNAVNVGKNKSLVGGSTITQQVVKNFLLTNERSLDRKIKEAILAFRITQAFSKDKIMELYLNQIFLGNRSYGVAAAALNYFNKSLDELTIEEAAMLAALPKAPTNLDPKRFPERAKERRDWVIERMADEGFINEVEAVLAMSKPIQIEERSDMELVSEANFFSEAVRQQLLSLYGEEEVYEKGLAVRTTLDPDMQKYAQQALQRGIQDYDKRHGWRGSIGKINDLENWKEELKKTANPVGLGKWQLAVVTSLSDKEAKIGLKNGEAGEIPLANMTWAYKYLSASSHGGKVTKVSDVLAKGDIIAVSASDKKDEYKLEQIPKVNGAIVVINPHNGNVLAMSGGYVHGTSQFNRAMQAMRQPGSSFKPFVYLAALENGYAPNSIIVDEPVELNMGKNMPAWQPKNYSGEFYGPTTLRVGVEKSRNAMTVKLAQELGIEKVMEVSKRFGIYDKPERNFSIVLGSQETTLTNLTNAYAMLVNGGKRITPSIIERIQDNSGKIIYKRDKRPCPECVVTNAQNPDEIMPPVLSEERKIISDPIATFQLVSILEGVVQRGTGQKLLELDKVVAGKTGTTNDSFDSWFVGFTADLAIGVYVGFDNPATLGKMETGASVALPIWKDFAQNALKDKPDIPFRRPSGVKMVKIDAETGLLPSPATPKKRIIYEAFMEGTEPTSSSASDGNWLTPSQQPNSTDGDTQLQDFGTGGVY